MSGIESGTPEPIWSTEADVRRRWVGAGFPEEADIDQLLVDAEQEILWEYPELPDRVVDTDESGELPDNPLPVDRLVMVICRMVLRHLRNPEGIRQVTETEGPFSRNRTFAGPQPSEVFLTDRERLMLGYLPGAPRPKAFTVPQDTPQPGVLGGGSVLG